MEVKDIEIKLSQLDEKVKSLTHVKKEDQVVSRQRLQTTIDEAKQVFNGLRNMVTDLEAHLAAAEDKVGGSAAEDDARKEVAAARAEVEAQLVHLKHARSKLNNLDIPPELMQGN
ncbi:hypothetical protein ACLB2K_011273 [Fragaria x ananassa]